MKKFLLSLVLTISILAPTCIVYAGSDSFVGGLAGGAVGSMVGSALTRDKGGSRRAEAEAREARMRAESAERQTFQTRGTMTTILIISLFVLFFIVIGLFLFVLKMKKKE